MSVMSHLAHVQWFPTNLARWYRRVTDESWLPIVPNKPCWVVQVQWGMNQDYPTYLAGWYSGWGIRTTQLTLLDGTVGDESGLPNIPCWVVQWVTNQDYPTYLAGLYSGWWIRTTQLTLLVGTVGDCVCLGSALISTPASLSICSGVPLRFPGLQ
jgi:hypothetical protein